MDQTLNPFERFVSLFTPVRAGEGRTVLFFFMYAFLILVSLTLFKNFRESIILAGGNAANKSYVNALAAVALLFFMPIYSALFRRFSREKLVAILAIGFAAMGFAFAILRHLISMGGGSIDGMVTGYSYYVWVSIFGVVMVTQFWVFANGSFNIKSGKRIFPVLLIGASSGLLIGSQIARVVTEELGITLGIVLTSSIVALTAFFPTLCRKSVPIESRCVDCDLFEPSKSLFGGISVVFNSRLMWLIAIYSLLLNTINSSSDYLFAAAVVEKANSMGITDAATREVFVGGIYANATFWISVLSLFMQAFVVSRIFIYVGIRRAVMIVPVILAVAYSLGGFFPIFSFIYFLRVLDNTLDGSLSTGIRQAIYLPTSHAEKFEAKTAIDTLIWRMGDVIQAVMIYLAVEHLGWGIAEISVMCGILGFAWIINAKLLSTEYHARIEYRSTEGPKVNRSLERIPIIPGDRLDLMVPDDLFVTSDPSDHLSLTAAQKDGASLPSWLEFDASSKQFRGNVPDQVNSLEIAITATDNMGLSATDEFVLEPA